MLDNFTFDNEKYIAAQTEEILERVKMFNNKLYLEFGGKLLFDYHASRVLPGYDPNVKMRLLRQLKDKADIILCIFAGDIERRKVRADFGITYDSDALKLIDDLREWEIEVTAVVITRFDNQPSAVLFKNKLERRNIKVYTHYAIKGYPADIDMIVSDNGYGKNQFIEASKPLVVVTGPGPGSGKLSTCLSQLYHEHKRGRNAGYAKFETFPIWNLPLKHPVNIAYEAATADLRDVNMIDPFHLEAYGKATVNYNRDIEIFPVISRILETITGSKIYKSPTDMGVNKAGFAITDDKAACEAAKQETIRRFFRYRCEYVMGLTDIETVNRAQVIMQELNISETDRKVVEPARKAAEECRASNKGNEGVFCGASLELKTGKIITGKNSPQFHASSSLVLNAIKILAEIPDRIHLLSPQIIESIHSFKKNILRTKTPSLDLEETLTALCISAITNPTAQEAMEKLKDLHGCEMHMTHLPTTGDEGGLRRLGVNLTTDPNFGSKNLFLK
ncbi:MAG TPA: hypothetical protein DCZ94_02050 [Lentisphaeria bacterium]|nr:MAG: hypothetical protein A2X48_22770 [Lentisphaerae bacterium GWF2_49_21]HBC85716.1 hypothetical protein [Lentisphaeria bacterium]